VAQTIERDLLQNRRARFEYELLDHFEAGVALLGAEVKSLRDGKGNLQESFVEITAEGAWVLGLHITPYAFANRNAPDPLRKRRLLLNRAELAKLRKGVAEKGLTIIPIRIYLKGSLIKIEIALARGKKLHDKRASIREREVSRDLRRGR